MDTVASRFVIDHVFKQVGLLQLGHEYTRSSRYRLWHATQWDLDTEEDPDFEPQSDDSDAEATDGGFSDQEKDENSPRDGKMEREVVDMYIDLRKPLVPEKDFAGYFPITPTEGHHIYADKIDTDPKEWQPSTHKVGEFATIVTPFPVAIGVVYKQGVLEVVDFNCPELLEVSLDIYPGDSRPTLRMTSAFMHQGDSRVQTDNRIICTRRYSALNGRGLTFENRRQKELHKAPNTDFPPRSKEAIEAEASFDSVIQNGAQPDSSEPMVDDGQAVNRSEPEVNKVADEATQTAREAFDMVTLMEGDSIAAAYIREFAKQ